MGNEVYRAIDEPIRSNLSWEERWRGEDQGLIQCWETGRARGDKELELRKRVKEGELPPLNWKGGITTKLKAKVKYGSLYYLAELQGIGAEDLNIDLSQEHTRICSKTGQTVVLTPDSIKYEMV
jgi:hypothetical protein